MSAKQKREECWRYIDKYVKAIPMPQQVGMLAANGGYWPPNICPVGHIPASKPILVVDRRNRAFCISKEEAISLYRPDIADSRELMQILADGAKRKVMVPALFVGGPEVYAHPMLVSYYGSRRITLPNGRVLVVNPKDRNCGPGDWLVMANLMGSPDWDSLTVVENTKFEVLYKIEEGQTWRN